MKINKETSKKILVISESLSGKGGVVSVIKTLSSYYEVFNHIPSTCQKNALRKLITFCKCIVLLMYYIFRKDIKIAHIHGASYGSFVRKSILIYICKAFQVKVIYHIHSGAFNIFRDKYNRWHCIDKVFKKVDCLIVLSEKWKKYFELFVSEEKILILNNIVSEVPISASKTHRLPLPIHFLFLGVINNDKGIFDLLSVISENREYFNNRIILHIGGIGDVDKLNNLIQTKDISRTVKYHGWVSGEIRAKLLNSSNVYILPSYYEGLPVSILEAMSYGLAIISTDVGGIPDIVKDGVNGFLVKPGDNEALFNVIKQIINNDLLLYDMGLSSLDLVKPYYPSVVIPKLNRVYHKLCIIQYFT